MQKYPVVYEKLQFSWRYVLSRKPCSAGWQLTNFVLCIWYLAISTRFNGIK